MQYVSRCVVAAGLVWFAVIPSPSVRGQVGSGVVPESGTFSEETDVVVVDRLVGLDGATGWLRGGKLPKGLEASEFQAWIVADEASGAPRLDLVPVALEKVVRGLPEMAEPWRVEVLVDSALASTRTVKWACSLLAERAEALTSLGEVSVALSGTDPAAGVDIVLLPTRDAAEVQSLLSRLALVGKGHDAVLARRGRWLEADGGDADRAAQAEVEMLRRGLDARVLHLEAAARVSGARRLLVWITDGFDLSPATFYSTDLVPDRALADHLVAVSRALAADGWVAVALHLPDADPFRGRAKGVRIGKWRFLGGWIGIGGVYEAERDPDLSEAYLDLGDQRLAGGDVAAAADAYDRAYYHFWNDPATSDRQAAALLRLADCLESLGDRDGARRARLQAAELEPEIAARYLATGNGDSARPDVARLLDAEAPLRRLAADTSGAVATVTGDVDDQIFDLARRLRLTVQLPAQLPPGLRRIEIAWRGESVRAPHWLRAGEASAVSEARSRRGNDRK